MKNYQSEIEGVWVEILNVELTEEQNAILASDDKEAIVELVNWIKSEREGAVSEAKSLELSSFYDGIKPELKEDDVYQLISIDLSEENNKFIGILNCRVNEEHIQIRF
jgi:hypothetical protein